MFDWNDLRYFLAVARTGTTLAASRELRVSQSTVARRIAALEAELRLPLFEKLQSGYVLTESGMELREAAEGAEAAMLAFGAKAASFKRGLSGTVRLTTNDLMANVVLVKAMAAFRTAFPDLRLEVVVADRFFDLAEGEADIALRAGPRPTTPGLFGRCLLTENWNFYCSADYAAAHGIPRSPQDLASHTFIGMDRGPLTADFLDWIADYVTDADMPLRPNTYSGLYAAIRNGLGVGVMSDMVAACDPSFVLCFASPMPLTSEIWLITHERLKKTPRIRAVMDFIAGHMASTKAGRVPA